VELERTVNGHEERIDLEEGDEFRAAPSTRAVVQDDVGCRSRWLSVGIDGKDKNRCVARGQVERCRVGWHGYVEGNVARRDEDAMGHWTRLASDLSDILTWNQSIQMDVRSPL
jgi:hypothetical protein